MGLPYGGFHHTKSTSTSLIFPPVAEGGNGTNGRIATPLAPPKSTPSEETTNEAQAALEAIGT